MDYHKPKREDGVARWLQRLRDQEASDSIEYQTIDGLLGRYNDCADFGLSLLGYSQIEAAIHKETEGV